MIHIGTKVTVADNTGARVAQCIGILENSKQKAARIGDKVVVVIKKALPDGTVKRHDVSQAVVIRTKNELMRESGECIRFGDNAVVLINNNSTEIKGSRIFGPTVRELSSKNFNKILSLAEEVL